MLVVDDGSPDGTADMAEIVGKELGNIEVLRRGGKSGLGSAYRAGFRWGLDRGFDACIEMDADLSHEPEALPSLVAPLADGHELVIGSRYIPGGVIPNWAWHRRLLSRGGNLYASTLLGLGVADATAGFRAYAATLLRRLDLDAVRAEGYGFQIEMTYAAKKAGAPSSRYRSASSTVSRASRRCRPSSWSRHSAWSPCGVSSVCSGHRSGTGQVVRT